ncbi:RNA-directed DNA polymerase, eukaryota [Tanacetum coccineum]
MEHVNLLDIRSCWGNFTFDFVVGPSVGNSRGILCVWDPNMFHKENSTVSDYFIAIWGKWLPNDKSFIIISVYAPQELSEKQMLWQYLVHVIKGWNGDVIIMGDFNEVRTEAKRFGSTFNTRGAAAFNSFISTGGLVEVPSGGYAYTWAHKSATKMSKLDRFLISENLMKYCPNISSITLDAMNSLNKLEKMKSLELAQKSKIKWAIEGYENSKYFHGIINKKYNNLAFKGIDLILLDMEFPNVLSYEQAQDLERVFTKDEIKQLVWDCGLDKSPGPDGFTFGFYRKFWSLLKDDVIDVVCYFFTNGFCLKGINSSFIALILKSQGATMVKDFRPISLIGSIYKIIAKLLANRLVTVLDDLVNEVQSTFIANRQI